MCIAHSDKVRYWVFAQTDVSRFGTVAVLRSIWWMDITAVFYGVDLSPEARYKVQWRLRTDNESAIVGSEFRAVIFGKDEVKKGDGLVFNAMSGCFLGEYNPRALNLSFPLSLSHFLSLSLC